MPTLFRSFVGVRWVWGLTGFSGFLLLEMYASLPGVSVGGSCFSQDRGVGRPPGSVAGGGKQVSPLRRTMKLSYSGRNDRFCGRASGGRRRGGVGPVCGAVAGGEGGGGWSQPVQVMWRVVGPVQSRWRVAAGVESSAVKLPRWMPCQWCSSTRWVVGRLSCRAGRGGLSTRYILSRVRMR